MQMTHSSNTGCRAYQSVLPVPEELNFQTDKNYLFLLPDLAVISVIGGQTRDFLQGQLTCDMNRIDPNTMSPGAMCNLKGRILALPHVLDWHGYKMILPNDLIVDTIASLSKTAMLSRVVLEADRQLTVLGLRRTNDKDIIPDFPLPLTSHAVTFSDQHCCYAIANDLFVIIADRTTGASLIQKYNEKQQLRGSLAWHHLQLENHHVAIYPETRGLFLPHRLDLPRLGYISFDKGCYKGQEIIARTHYRAKLKHHLQTFIINATQPLIPGSKLLDADTNQEVGELVDYCARDEHSFLIAASILIDHPQHIKIEGHHDIITL
ncbi:CAF17-like 4Fe-4S cluster assembly/insertion protein YgfZ [Legionella spiritensis]|uniref:CAF17-like 4Fe-4S cluster assembly/insertion protein YgfZ n=1 Tax=Legionella spiritensis TaxID=452 RepID=UPI000F6ECA63|nr:folate-binding protein YgfZ [Legionella spiritensis]VEG89977.1 glycine cleavage T protein [Legionella spiritensis]